MHLKIESARRQLGMALDLFLREVDPVSAHCLASGGAEVIEHFADRNGRQALFPLLTANSGKTASELRRIQRQYWSAFKHATRFENNVAVPRDDEELLAEFRPEQNEAILFVAWTDYGNATAMMPIEAQVFTAWYMAKHPEKLAPEAARDAFEWLFPGLPDKAPSRQKAALIRKIADIKKLREIREDPRTELRPLVLGWPPVDETKR